MPNLRVTLAILLTVLFAAAAYVSWHYRTETIITTVPYLITKPGSYRLGRDLSYPKKAPGDKTQIGALIEIAAPDVTIDFHHHTLAGPDDAHTGVFGVYAWERENVVIKNGRVIQCYIGIYLSGTSAAGITHNANNRIEKMEVVHNYHVGVFLEAARNSIVHDCWVNFIGPSQRIPFSCGIVATGYGIELSHNFISDVVPASADAYGIFCNGATGVFAIDNIVSNCQYGISAGRYRNNMTDGCKLPFSSGIDSGGNN